MDIKDIEALIPFCTTDTQRERLKSVIEHGGSVRGAQKALGLSHPCVVKTIELVRRAAAVKGVAPDKDLNYPLPEGQVVTGTSTLQRSPAGNLQWVKTKTDSAAQLALMKEAIDALVKDVPRATVREKANVGNSDLLAVYPLGDPHIGMMSWGEETGEDWDLKIAEAKMLSVFDRLVNTAPPCKEAVIVNLGDFFHADNMEAVTQRSGHKLDVDGRYAKMVRVGMRIMRRMIESALSLHEKVTVINSVGNHDDTGALFMNVALANIYENEPRVFIDQSPAPFHYFRFGKVLIGAHHGHTCKAPQLPGVMAADRAKDWGDTEFRYWLTGHIHHDSMKEYPGVKVESFRTLAAKDAYSSWGGYRAGQDSKCLIMHRDFGEIERHTVCIQQIFGAVA